MEKAVFLALRFAKLFLLVASVAFMVLIATLAAAAYDEGVKKEHVQGWHLVLGWICFYFAESWAVALCWGGILYFKEGGGMKREVKITTATWMILKLLYNSSDENMWGLRIAKRLGLISATVYPVLMRLEKAEWVASYWELFTEAEDAGRPRRRFYILTDAGREVVHSIAEEKGEKL